MELSPNQYTRPMGEINDTFWQRLDRQLLEDEAELAREQAWVNGVAEECLTAFDEHLHSLSVEDHQAAIEGLRDYGREVGRDIDVGWHRRVDAT